jgi:hypothetical protein
MLAFLANDLLPFISCRLFTTFRIEKIPFLFFSGGRIAWRTRLWPSSALDCLWSPPLVGAPPLPLPSALPCSPLVAALIGKQQYRRRCPSLASSSTGAPPHQAVGPVPLLDKQQHRRPSSWSIDWKVLMCPLSAMHSIWLSAMHSIWICSSIDWRL